MKSLHLLSKALIGLSVFFLTAIQQPEREESSPALDCLASEVLDSRGDFHGERRIDFHGERKIDFHRLAKQDFHRDRVSSSHFLEWQPDLLS